MTPEIIARVGVWISERGLLPGLETEIDRLIFRWQTVTKWDPLGTEEARTDFGLGVLMRLVRRALRCPLAHVRCVGKDVWQVWTVDPRTGKWVCVSDEESELGSMCGALEASPSGPLV